jgi:hypothetical protein
MTDDHNTEKKIIAIYRGSTKLVVCKDPWNQFVVVETDTITELELDNLDVLATEISKNTNSDETPSVIVDWLLNGFMVTNHSARRWVLLRNKPANFVVAKFDDVQRDRSPYPNFKDETSAIAYAIDKAKISVPRGY